LNKSAYLKTSKTASFGLLAILPLLVCYEYLAYIINKGFKYQIRNHADIYIKQLFEKIGINGSLVIPGILAALAIALFLRQDDVKIKLRYFLYIILESACYAGLIGLIVGKLTDYILLTTVDPAGARVQIMLGLGAGVYEELVFRAIIYYYTAFTLIRLIDLDVWLGFFIAMCLSSVAFSWFHYISGAPFNWYSAVFRFFAGTLFCIMYQVRGLGVTAWTHSLYDVYIVLAS
jgi:hypothetical protein